MNCIVVLRTCPGAERLGQCPIIQGRPPKCILGLLRASGSTSNRIAPQDPYQFSDLMDTVSAPEQEKLYELAIKITHLLA